jgi:hypothetical protein
MVRTELEQLVAPAIAETVEAMRRACAAAGLGPDELSTVLLAGGSSRIPLVAQLVSAALDRPVTVDADPKAVVASGAALSIAPMVVEPAAVATRTVIAPVPTSRWSRRGLVMAVGVAACLAAVVATASTVGTDMLSGGTQADAADTSDLPREVVDRAPVGTPLENDDTDPWTGQPYEETTTPGPKRPDAKPTDASPATLTPAPTTGGNRDGQINGEPPSTQVITTTTPAPPTTGDDNGPIVRSSSTTDEPPVTTTPDPTTTTPEPPTTEPLPDPTTTTEPVEPPAGDGTP